MFGIAGHIEHLDRRALRHYLFRELAPAQAAGHDHIGQQQVNRSRICGGTRSAVGPSSASRT